MVRHSVVMAVIAVFIGVSPANAAEIDLKPTAVGKSLEGAIRAVIPTIGNQGAVELTRLTFNTETREVKGSITVRAKHSWGTVRVPAPTPTNPRRTRDIDVAVDAQGSGDFTYNAETGEVSADITIPLGERSINVLGQKYEWDFGEVKIRSDVIRRVLDGDLFAYLETIPSLGLSSKELRNDYEKIKKEKEQQFGVGNVIIARKKFVDEVKPSAALNDIISLILTAGASSEAIAKRLANLLEQEGNYIAVELQKKGVREAQQILPRLLKGEAVNLTDYYIAVHWQTIPFYSRTLILRRPVTEWIGETHGAYYIVIQRRNGGDGGIDGGETTLPQLFPADFDGDGKSDLGIVDMFPPRNRLEHRLNLWFLNGANGVVASPNPVQETLGARMRLIGTGDVDRDGKDDIFIFDPISRSIRVWLMDRNGIKSSPAPLQELVPEGWWPAAVGDIDGDGRVDLALRGPQGQVRLWFLTGGKNGKTGAWSVGIKSSPSELEERVQPSALLLGIFDADGDKKGDLLWLNPATGAVQVWLLTGETGAGGKVGKQLKASPDPYEERVPAGSRHSGIADVNQDGQPDLIWDVYDPETGSRNVSVWLLGRAAAPKYTHIIASPKPLSERHGVDFEVIGVGKAATTAGAADVILFWRSRTTHSIRAWVVRGKGNQVWIASSTEFAERAKVRDN